MKIVLVHGIFNTSHVMTWLRKQFERQGFECLTPTLTPLDARRGISHAAQQLTEYIDQHCDIHQRVILVGFSMGGIVARYYAQYLRGERRVSALFSISSPHHGSYLAWLPYPSLGMRQLRPKSQLLRELGDSESRLTGIRLFSYRTPLDLTIVPSRSSHWAAADNKVFWSPLHLSMIFSRPVFNEILRQVLQLAPLQQSAPHSRQGLEGAQD